jgi:hypothetical protein
MHSLMEFVYVAIMWLTPLLIAALARLQLRQAMSYFGRLSIWFAYVVWSVGWIWLWDMETNRTRDFTAQEIVAIAGFWATPFIGALLMLFAELARLTTRRPRGFDVLPVKEAAHGEDRNPR